MRKREIFAEMIKLSTHAIDLDEKCSRSSENKHYSTISSTFSGRYFLIQKRDVFFFIFLLQPRLGEIFQSSIVTKCIERQTINCVELPWSQFGGRWRHFYGSLAISIPLLIYCTQLAIPGISRPKSIIPLSSAIDQLGISPSPKVSFFLLSLRELL